MARNIVSMGDETSKVSTCGQVGCNDDSFARRTKKEIYEFEEDV